MVDGKPTLQVFLSYRSHYQNELKALKAALDAHNLCADGTYFIELKASEYELSEGDSITEFMQAIGAARFVILMLTKDYFQSPYCLHEMLETYESGQSELRLFPLSIKQDDSLHDVSATAIARWLDENFRIGETGEVGHCLARLMELYKIDVQACEAEKDDLRKRVLTAYETLVQNPLLEAVAYSPNAANELIAKIEAAAQKAFADEEASYKTLLIGHIEHHLRELKSEDKNELMFQLGERFEEQGLETAMASHLVSLPVNEAMTHMQSWCTARNKALLGNDWRWFFREVESLCGWLLLKSVDQNWWIHNRLAFRNAGLKKGQVALGMKKPAYAEVVIGKSLEKAALFCLNDYNNLVPAQHEASWHGLDTHTEAVGTQDDFVIDASPSARAEELLLPLIYDLKQQPDKMHDTLSVQLNELIDELKAVDQQRFYIVTQAYLDKLAATPFDGQPILERINQAVQDKLVFISYGIPTDQSHARVCQDETVLTKLATILRLDKNRKKGTVT